jgi:inorganic pyrophosphatase
MPTPHDDNTLHRIRQVQDTIEQQLDEIQHTLTALHERQTHLDNSFQNLTAALKLVLRVLPGPPEA